MYIIFKKINFYLIFYLCEGLICANSKYLKNDSTNCVTNCTLDNGYTY